MSALPWQKSSYSPEEANCLYLARSANGTIHLRESDAPDVILRATPAALRALLHRVKTGEFDHLAGA